MDIETQKWNQKLTVEDLAICNRLAESIEKYLPEATNKIWHKHPVWFLDDNPTVGYSKQKAGIRLMFWSGADFEEPGLVPGTGKFKDASAFFTDLSQLNEKDLARWLSKSKEIQWDYKNIYKRKGQLVRLK